MTPQEVIDHLRALEGEATPGPWRVHEGKEPWRGSLVADGEDEDGPTVSLILGRNNNDLMVASRNHFKALLDVAEAASKLYDDDAPTTYDTRFGQLSASLVAALARLAEVEG